MRTLLLSVQVGQVPTYTNTASLATVAQPDINPSNNSASVVLVPNLNADLDVEKTVDNATPAVDQQVTFTVTLRNLGPSPALGVVANDRLARRAAIRLGHAVAGHVRFDDGRVDRRHVAGRPASRHARHTVDHGARHRSLERWSTRCHATATNDLAGDTASATVTASRIADLVIAKSDGLTSIAAGAQLTYTIARQQRRAVERRRGHGRGHVPRPAPERDLDVRAGSGSRRVRRRERRRQHRDHGGPSGRSDGRLHRRRDRRSGGPRRHPDEHGDRDAARRHDRSRSLEQHLDRHARRSRRPPM